MEKDKCNNIIAAFETNEDNETIRIINSFEEFRRENILMKDEDEYHNEKEIKENCEIRIDGEIIPFSYKYKFNKKGKYTFLYIFKNYITNTNYMFRGCLSLTNINLSNFNTNNVIDMNNMFFNCCSITFFKFI